MLGPMVAVKNIVFILFMPIPFKTAFTFSAMCLSGKETFPTGRWRIRFPGSVFMFTWPLVNSFTRFSTSGVTVPVFGFGMRPLGPNIRATLASCGIIDG